MKQLRWMRYLIALFSVSLAAQNQPVCTGITLEVDARCACVKDPNSQACGLVKAGIYEPHDMGKIKAMSTGVGGTTTPPVNRSTVPVRPQQARVVPLAHKDYLRFLQPMPKRQLASISKKFSSRRN